MNLETWAVGKEIASAEVWDAFVRIYFTDGTGIEIDGDVGGYVEVNFMYP